MDKFGSLDKKGDVWFLSELSNTCLLYENKKVFYKHEQFVVALHATHAQFGRWNSKVLKIDVARA